MLGHISNNDNPVVDEIMLHLFNDALEKIEHGDKSTIHYYTIFQHYKSIQKKNEYKKEIDKYAKLILDSALNVINNYNKLPDYEKFEEVNSNIAQEYYYLAIIFDYYKNKKQKFYNINKAIELNPHNADYYFLRGQYYEEIYRFKKAEIDYKKVIEIGDEMSVRDAKTRISIQKTQIKTLPIIFLVIIYVLILILYNFIQLPESTKDILAISFFVIYVLLFIYVIFLVTIYNVTPK